MTVKIYGADVEIEDSFNGRPFDYGKMIGSITCLHPPMPKHIRVYNNYKTSSANLESWTIAQIEEYLLPLSPCFECLVDHQ